MGAAGEWWGAALVNGGLPSGDRTEGGAAAAVVVATLRCRWRWWRHRTKREEGGGRQVIVIVIFIFCDVFPKMESVEIRTARETNKPGDSAFGTTRGSTRAAHSAPSSKSPSHFSIDIFAHSAPDQDDHEDNAREPGP